MNTPLTQAIRQARARLHGARFTGPGTITIGPRVTIERDVLIGGQADVRIGADSKLSRETQVLADSPVVIGERVEVMEGATILGGVTIGNGAIIGLNAVVKSDVPAGAIAAGNPAQIVGHASEWN